MIASLKWNQKTQNDIDEEMKVKQLQMKSINIETFSHAKSIRVG